MTTTAIDSTRAAELFHALSDPIRVDVVAQLIDGERCVCDLMDDLELQQSRRHGGGSVEAFSAGWRPSGKVNPRAIAAMAE